MTQTNNRFLDELAKLMTDAAGAAQGMRRDFETMMKAQGERMLRDMDVVQREEFEAVKEMAVKAREENEQLAARVAALEAELAALTTSALSGAKAFARVCPQAIPIPVPRLSHFCTPASQVATLAVDNDSRRLATRGSLVYVADRCESASDNHKSRQRPALRHAGHARRRRTEG